MVAQSGQELVNMDSELFRQALLHCLSRAVSDALAAAGAGPEDTKLVKDDGLLGRLDGEANRYAQRLESIKLAADTQAAQLAALKAGKLAEEANRRADREAREKAWGEAEALRQANLQRELAALGKGLVPPVEETPAVVEETP